MLINRFVINSIEGRILAGITMFVAVMILVGWVAINEPARMASFEEQHLGRSIERGGELFAANCSTCHGKDSLGIAGRAPALRNPQLFGFNFIDAVNGQILGLERQWNDLDTQLETLNTDRGALTAELGSGTVTAERQTEIATRLTEINAQINPDDPESIAGRIAALQAQLEPLYAERDTQLMALEQAMLADYLPKYNQMRAAADSGGVTEKFSFTVYLDQDADRLAQVGWGGDLAGYIRTTLIHGRPGSNNLWPQAMVAWSQTGGGPLRADQIDDIVNYILNYNKGDAWTLEDLYAVQQFARLPGSGGAGPAVATLGTDVDSAVTAVAALTGDADRGKQLYEGQARSQANARFGCSGCHMGGSQAPDTELTWANVTGQRLNEAQFAGWTPEQYLIHSIVLPNEYIVTGYSSGVMPANFGEQMTAQDMADIIAYLRSYAEGG
ncbi:MAG: c-type cytochrome [Anaerolineae bacterium]|nr:c-type cytochrome [Anaerolineae bacterium]